MAGGTEVLKDIAGAAGPGHALGLLVAGGFQEDSLKPRVYRELTSHERDALRDAGSNWHLAGTLGGGVIGAGIGVGSALSTDADPVTAGLAGWAGGSLVGSLALPAAHAWYSTNKMLNDPEYRVEKLSAVAPLARIGPNAPVANGSNTSPQLMANPYGSRNVPTPDAHDYENGYQFAQQLGMQQLQTVSDSRWHSWQQHPTAWKHGFRAALHAMGIGRYEAKLDTPRAQSMDIDPLIFTDPAKTAGIMPFALPLAAAPIGAAMLYADGRNNVTHENGVTSGEQDDVRNATGGAVANGLANTASTVMDDALLGGVAGAGISAVDRYGIVPHAWNSVNNAVVNGGRSVAEGFRPVTPPAAPNTDATMAERIRGNRAATGQSIANAADNATGARYNFDPASEHGTMARTFRGGIAGAGLGLVAGIPHALASSYINGQEEARHALSHIRSAHDMQFDPTKQSAFKGTSVDTDSEFWAADYLKVAFLNFDPVGTRADNLIAPHRDMSAVDADNARPGLISSAAGDIGALGAGVGGAALGGLAGAIGTPLIGSALTAAGMPGVGEALSNGAAEGIGGVAGAALGGALAHKGFGEAYADRHTG